MEEKDGREMRENTPKLITDHHILGGAVDGGLVGHGLVHSARAQLLLRWPLCSTIRIFAVDCGVPVFNAFFLINR